MIKTFKYRLLGNKAVFRKADTWLYLCCWLYNTALSQRISIYKQNKGQISNYSQQKQVIELKEGFPEYKSVSSQTIIDVLDRLDIAYKGFFRRVKKGDKRVGFPRFKSRDRYDSFTMKSKGWKVEGKYLIIKKIGRFKMRLSRPIEGTIKTITIKKESNKWYACFNCGDVPEKKLPVLDNVIGLDVGVKSFLVDSEGVDVANPRYFKQIKDLLRIRNRKLSRRKKGSNRRKEAKLLVSKTCEKIGNQRTDFLHKLSTQYVKNYGTLVFEDLNIVGLVKNPCMAKSILDAGWGKFYGYCAYKAAEAGRQVVRIPPHYTSNTCSQCGAVNHKLKLTNRKWVCMDCGVLHDRDYNAAKNIKRVGQTQQELTCAAKQCVSCESHNLDKGSANEVNVDISSKKKVKVEEK